MEASAPRSIGQQLRQFRLIAGLSQEALAEASEVSVRTISDLERGQRSSAHLETVRRLATALDLTGDEHRHLLETVRPAAIDSIPAHAGPQRWTTSLPIPTSPFVGRAQELDDLLSTVREPTRKIVTITGTGGVGKTRLAVEAAHRMATIFDDGSAIVQLATVAESERVAAAIAKTFGLTPQHDAAGDQLVNFLSNRELFLVLDNFEHLIDAAPLVAHLAAACPMLAILVTSRARLRVSSEREFALAPLHLATPTDSLERLQLNEANLLFAARATRVDPNFTLSNMNAMAVTEICRTLDGLPLAIELAAARLRVLPVPALLARLDHRLPLLTGGDRDHLPRQQSMRGAIAWSYDLLRPIEQRFFRWMSVFIGELSLDAAEALGSTMGLDRIASLETVTTLVDNQLVQRLPPSNGHPRFHMLETIREYGLEQLTETRELDAARRFHATHFLAFASRDAPRPYDQIGTEWIARLATEHANLIAAFDVLSVPASAEQSLQFAAAMGPFWHTRGPFSEWQVRLDRVLGMSASEPTILKAHVLFWASLIRGISPEYQPALQAARQCMAVADQVGTASDKAAALQVMAWVQECHEHWASALEVREQAIEIWTQVGNSYMHAICLVHNAGIAYRLGELDRARCAAEQADNLFRVLGNLDWSAGATWYLGLIAVARGRLDLGAVYFEQSLHTWLESESASRWYRSLVGLADVAAAIGRFTTAAHLLGSADAMIITGGRQMTPFDRPGYERAETRCREVLGNELFENCRRAGHRLSPDDWFGYASAIVDAAQASSALAG